MKKSFGIFIMTAISLFLTGCAAAPTRVVVTAECTETEGCGASVKAEWELKSIGKSLVGFDASLVELDFSSSSNGVSLTTSSGYAVVKVTSGSGQVNTNAFAWSLIGDSIVLDDPAGAEAWVDDYFDQAVEIEVDYGSFQTTETEGVNTLVAESVYAGQIQGGDATSWYVNGQGGDGPPQQQK